MILENKLGLTNQVELAKVEEKLSKQKAKELYDCGKINEIEVGTFKGLSEFMNFYFRIFTILPEKSDRSILQKEIFDLHQLCI
ncbi:Fic family protein [Enterococcus faecium]|nr:Fic family protein [Enterococcus faecium]